MLLDILGIVIAFSMGVDMNHSGIVRLSRQVMIGNDDVDPATERFGRGLGRQAAAVGSDYERSSNLGGVLDLSHLETVAVTNPVWQDR